jgi:hypothetical protein
MLLKSLIMSSIFFIVNKIVNNITQYVILYEKIL